MAWMRLPGGFAGAPPVLAALGILGCKGREQPPPPPVAAAPAPSRVDDGAPGKNTIAGSAGGTPFTRVARSD
jgi:hypothetical protein